MSSMLPVANHKIFAGKIYFNPMLAVIIIKKVVSMKAKTSCIVPSIFSDKYTHIKKYKTAKSANQIIIEAAENK